MGIGLKMNNFEETIRHSMRQTTDCQAMANKAIEWCKELMEYVEILEKENKLLKQKLSKTMQS